MAEALRLADRLEGRWALHPDMQEAAAELRRLSAENKLLHERHHDDNVEYTRVLAQRDALLEALKTYGWHTEDCPQHPTYAQPENWPDCTCGFDDAIRARGTV